MQRATHASVSIDVLCTHPGLLPIHPLMEPRRLTDGALSNTSNAWGSAAVEAAGSVSGLRARLGSPSQLLGDMGTSPGAGTVSGALEGGDWNLLSSVSGVNSSAGWNALGADSAATMSSRAGMTSAGAGRGTPAEDSTSGTDTWGSDGLQTATKAAYCLMLQNLVRACLHDSLCVMPKCSLGHFTVGRHQPLPKMCA